MLLIVFIFFVKIELLSCIFENKNEQELFDEINRERKNLGISKIEMHLTLQLAAQKRCADREELIEAYKRMISKTYRDDDWPRQEQLDKIFSHVAETIYLNGVDIRDDIFQNSLIIPNMYRTTFIFIGIGLSQHKNFSARCILYGSSNNSISNHRRLLRLLYILIGCGLLLLSLILCSIINDRRRVKLKQQLEQEQLMIDSRHSVVPKKSMTVFVDKDQISAPRRTEINRMTMARLGSTVDERPSAVHSFFQSPK